MSKTRFRRADRRRRRGVTMVETAFVLSALMLVLLVMLDLGLAVLHYNSLSAASRWVAREAVVHGEKASPERTPWGPAAYSGAASDPSSEIAATARRALAACDAQDVTVAVEWLDGDVEIGDRVQVTLSCDYEPIVPVLFGWQPFVMSATSTMRITH